MYNFLIHQKVKSQYSTTKMFIFHSVIGINDTQLTTHRVMRCSNQWETTLTNKESQLL